MIKPLAPTPTDAVDEFIRACRALHALMLGGLVVASSMFLAEAVQCSTSPVEATCGSITHGNHAIAPAVCWAFSIAAAVFLAVACAFEVRQERAQHVSPTTMNLTDADSAMALRSMIISNGKRLSIQMGDDSTPFQIIGPPEVRSFTIDGPFTTCVSISESRTVLPWSQARRVPALVVCVEVHAPHAEVTFAVVPRQGWTAARVEREVKQVIYA